MFFDRFLFRRPGWPCAALLLALPAAAQPVFAPAPGPETFTPSSGFGGSSSGQGVLELAFGHPRPFHVQSQGRALDDGRFQLDQTVTFDGEAPTTRQWLITTDAPGHYVGTLSDAAGPVTGETEGRRLTLRYRIKGLFYMHQTLVLAPDGRTIDNQDEITLLGLPVGHLHETIARQDPA